MEPTIASEASAVHARVGEAVKSAPVPRREPELMVVGGGKGGVGKTCFSVNAAVEIGRKGWKVVLVDADLSCSNLETMLGQRAEKRLDDFFHQRGRKNLEPIVSKTKYENLSVVPGTTGLVEVANPKFQQKAALLRELRKLDADLVIIDLDAGAHLDTLDFFLQTESNGVVVITPEKTSVDNCFKFLRATLFRKIERFYRSPEVAQVLKRKETLGDLLESIRSIEDFETSMKNRLCGEIIALAQSFRPQIVVNRAKNEVEARGTANVLIKYLRQLLMIEAEMLGHVVFDTIVPQSVNSGVPFVASHPREPVARCVVDIVNRMGYR